LSHGGSGHGCGEGPTGDFHDLRFWNLHECIVRIVDRCRSVRCGLQRAKVNSIEQRTEASSSTRKTAGVAGIN